jgi:hypothetical protein
MRSQQYIIVMCEMPIILAVSLFLIDLLVNMVACMNGLAN